MTVSLVLYRCISMCILYACFLRSCASLTCGQGEFLVPNVTCRECPDGMYNDHSNHTMETCYHCPRVDLDLPEVELKPCTKTSPSDIGCKNGYARVGELCKPQAQTLTVGVTSETSFQSVTSAPTTTTSTTTTSPTKTSITTTSTPGTSTKSRSYGIIALSIVLPLGVVLFALLLYVMYRKKCGPWRPTQSDNVNNPGEEVTIPLRDI